MTHDPKITHIDILDCIVFLFKNRLEPTNYIGMTTEWYVIGEKSKP